MRSINSKDGDGEDFEGEVPELNPDSDLSFENSDFGGDPDE
tara:strand:+ start:8061 stop:8183 length:123 start_codon:yes stop_codon:yes gene_type:complete